MWPTLAITAYSAAEEPFERAGLGRRLDNHKWFRHNNLWPTARGSPEAPDPRLRYHLPRTTHEPSPGISGNLPGQLQLGQPGQQRPARAAPVRRASWSKSCGSSGSSAARTASSWARFLRRRGGALASLVRLAPRASRSAGAPPSPRAPRGLRSPGGRDGTHQHGEHVLGVLDQRGAVADQLVAAAVAAGQHGAGDDHHFSSLRQRAAGRDERAALVVGLDDDDAVRQPADQPIALPEVIGQRRGPGRELAQNGAAAAPICSASASCSGG